MNNMKKLASLLLALVMVLAMAAPAMAEDAVTPKITVKADDTHTYAVYQIFTGDVSGTTLSNVVWGQNGTGTDGEAVPGTTLDALTALNTNETSDTAKLAEIKNYVKLDSAAIGTVSAEKALEVEAGYYLLVDLGVAEESEEGEETEGGFILPEGDSYSLYVVEIVGVVTVDPKRGNVESNKKVDDKNDSNTEEDETKWHDSADYDIGDEVPFKLTGTVPENYDDYESFYYAFHDVQSSGLTFKPETVVVKVDGVTIETGYQVVTTGLNDGCTFEVVFNDLKAVTAVNAESVITIEYKSELNNGAIIGSAGNPNTMHLEYSNNPNSEYDGNGNPDDDDTGKTPDDTVIVFTYQTVVNKVDENGEKLAGAEFTLEKFVADENGAETYKNVKGAWTALELVKNEAGTVFTFKGLDDGEYRITETVTPSGYNTIAPIYFTVNAEHELLSDNPALKSLTVSSTADIEEVKDGETVVTEGKKAFTVTLNNGNIATDVVNKPGAQLPETGGMGTTMIYVIGCLLVAGAAIMMFAKKRAASK